MILKASLDSHQSTSLSLEYGLGHYSPHCIEEDLLVRWTLQLLVFGDPSLHILSVEQQETIEF